VSKGRTATIRTQKVRIAFHIISQTLTAGSTESDRLIGWETGFEKKRQVIPYLKQLTLVKNPVKDTDCTPKFRCRVVVLLRFTENHVFEHWF